MNQINAPEPGIYTEIPADDYHGWPYASSSKLKQILQSPAHYRYYVDNPTETDTPTLAFGRAYHDAVLLPEVFEREYIAKPAGMRRGTNLYKEWKSCVDDEGMIELDHNDYKACIDIRDAINAHPEASALLSGKGKNEASLVWDDDKTGIRCRGRIDRFTTHEFLEGYPESKFVRSCHVDLKGTTDASREGFMREIAKYKYHMQAAFYLDGANALSPANRVFAFVVFEKKPPYAVAVYVLDDDAIEQGRREYRRALDLLDHCNKQDDWPSYTQTITPISVPVWALDPETRMRI